MVVAFYLSNERGKYRKKIKSSEHNEFNKSNFTQIKRLNTESII